MPETYSTDQLTRLPNGMYTLPKGTYGWRQDVSQDLMVFYKNGFPVVGVGYNVIREGNRAGLNAMIVAKGGVPLPRKFRV